MPQSKKDKPVTPDYEELVKFLVGPFLERPDSLRIDCEFLPTSNRVWVRMAFEGDDRGRFFGRGGRNIQAIRAILEGIAKTVGQSVCLDIYGFQGASKDSDLSGNSAGSGRGNVRGSRGPSSRVFRERPTRKPYREKSQ